MADPIDVARELFDAVAAADRDRVAGCLAADVRWRGRERGPRWRRRRDGCTGRTDATTSMLLIGRKLPTIRPRTFQAAGARVMVGLWADTMEGRPARWWTVLTIRDDHVIGIEDHTRLRDAVRTLEHDPRLTA